MSNRFPQDGLTRRGALSLIGGTVLLARGGARLSAAVRHSARDAGPRVPQPPLASRAVADLRLPLQPDSVRLLIIGDSGTGGREQQEVADQIVACRAAFPFDTALMLGDNIYGRHRPVDFVKKFERPYQPLLDAGVRFHAALGNHDNANTQRRYAPFNMGGERYSTFTQGDVRFFALDSTLMDRAQLDWLGRELAQSPESWKVAFAHHPLYSSGARHGSEMSLRKAVEPLFREHGVSVMLAGHDHFYERCQPQHGIQHFVCGGAAKLRRGNIRRGPLTATGFDRDRSFMLVEIAGETLFFQAISRTGQTVDTGAFPRVAQTTAVLAGV